MNAITIVLVTLAGCSSGASNQICTTTANRATISCTPTQGPGCLGSDLGYADTNVYPASCTAPRHGDSTTCAPLFSCDTSGATPQWEPDVGF